MTSSWRAAVLPVRAVTLNLHPSRRLDRQPVIDGESGYLNDRRLVSTRQEADQREHSLVVCGAPYRCLDRRGRYRITRPASTIVTTSAATAGNV
jgi:hypothetical protein